MVIFKIHKIPNSVRHGSGEGSVTLPFLELGAHVVAVDLSEFQLKSLREKSKQYGDRLEIRCQDINQTLNKVDEKFDIIVANSFLHHLPDYIEILEKGI
ncbi:MAG: class I SAM-dependent methyltransferase [Saprospiraceae bacterium]|nr:class I SAM-dependent methyltransferase [Candidatus Brachybacter algidus]